MERIAEVLNVNTGQISRDLECFDTMSGQNLANSANYARRLMAQAKHMPTYLKKLASCAENCAP